jgi:hypothetical protein
MALQATPEAPLALTPEASIPATGTMPAAALPRIQATSGAAANGRAHEIPYPPAAFVVA